MKCEREKVIGWRWNMKWEYLDPLMGKCSYPAKYKLRITEKKKQFITWTCGIHKNQLVRHGSQVGYKVEILEKELKNEC